jgi:solute:Na+ symporter, SSS family
MNPGLGATDSLIVVVYMLVVLLFGLWVGRGRKSSADYFLANRSLPWGALLLSIVATETSTVTFLSIPGIAAAAGGNLTFLQITFGYIAGRLFVVFVLLPLYFRGKAFTAYEVLESRFGQASRRTVSTLFLLTRNAGDSLRLFLTALVLQLAVGIDLTTSVIALGSVTLVYTFIGGAKSVIWNDCVQFVIYIIGAVAAGVVMIDVIPGGFAQIIEAATADDRLRVLDFDTSLVKPSMTFWAGLAGGAFLTAATHGTDQLMVQRYLSARRQADAALALGLSGFIVLLQFALFLLLGIGLAVMHGATDDAHGLQPDQLFASFLVNYLPTGLLGLALAAVFAAAMSTLSSSLNSSAAVFINDIYLPLRGEIVDQAAQVRASRLATILFGLLQTGLAVLYGWLGTGESTVANVLKISGFATGPVLGLYLLGVFAPRVGQRSALAGFVIGVAILSSAALGTSVHWAWYALIGSLGTFVAGWLVQEMRERMVNTMGRQA